MHRPVPNATAAVPRAIQMSQDPWPAALIIIASHRNNWAASRVDGPVCMVAKWGYTIPAIQG